MAPRVVKIAVNAKEQNLFVIEIKTLAWVEKLKKKNIDDIGQIGGKISGNNWRYTKNFGMRL